MTFEPILLKDKTRLQEIYDLRVDVWENSEKKAFVNRQLFPNGWYDDLDLISDHIIIVNELNIIIASARLSIFHRVEEIPYLPTLYRSFFKKKLPITMLSRVVVSDCHRNLKLSLKLDLYAMHNAQKKSMGIFGYSTLRRANYYVIKHKWNSIAEIEIDYKDGSGPHLVNLIYKFFDV